MFAMERPIQLVGYNHHARVFSIDAENLDRLRTAFAQLPGHVTVIGVAGVLRRGKSFLMNSMYHYPESPYGRGVDNGFALGTTVQSVTKGIWAWARPHPAGEGTLVLLDTEGMHDPDNPDPVYDAKVIAVSMALSSTLVYQFTGVLDATHLDNLQCITQITAKLQLRPDGEPQLGGSAFATRTPQLVMLGRDCHLDLRHPRTRRPCGERDYLEGVLEVDDDELSTPAGIQKLQIAQYFPNRQLRCLPAPHADARAVPHVPRDQLSAAFCDGLERLRLELLSKARPVPMAGTAGLTASQLLEFAIVVVNAINAADKVCIPTALEACAKIANDEAAAAAVAALEAAFADCGAPGFRGDAAFGAAERDALEAAASAFTARAMVSDAAQATRLLDALHDTFKRTVEAARDANDRAARAHIQPTVDRLVDRVNVLAASDELKREGGAAELGERTKGFVEELKAAYGVMANPGTGEQVFNGPGHVIASAVAELEGAVLRGYEQLNCFEAEAARIQGEQRVAQARKAEAAAEQQRHQMRQLAAEAATNEARATHERMAQQVRADQAAQAERMQATQAETLARIQEGIAAAKAAHDEARQMHLEKSARQAEEQRETLKEQQRSMMAMLAQQGEAAAKIREQSSLQMQGMFNTMCQLQAAEHDAAAKIAQAQAHVRAAEAAKPSFGEKLLGVGLSVLGGVATCGVSSALGIGAAGAAAAAASSV